MLHFLEVRGNARERGRQQGEHFRAQIAELAAIRGELVAGYLKQLRVTQIQALAMRMVRALQAYPLCFEEFSGISEGSGLSQVDLMILNNYTDMRDFVDFTDEGCSTLSLRNDKGAHVCGQSWDMHASARPYVAHIRHKGADDSDETLEILTVTGCLGLAGVHTRSNVAVFINNMHSRDNKIAIMWPALVRELLRQKDAPTALEYLGGNLPCSGRNYLICDPELSLNVETTASRLVVSARLKGPGAIFHTNHYVSELKSSELLERQSKTTHPRLQALEQYFAEPSALNKDYKSIGREVFGGEVAKAVCVEMPVEKHSAMTCGGIVLDMPARKGLSFGGLWREQKQREFSW